jgi:hypothetical protein
VRGIFSPIRGVCAHLFPSTSVRRERVIICKWGRKRGTAVDLRQRLDFISCQGLLALNRSYLRFVGHTHGTAP